MLPQNDNKVMTKQQTRIYLERQRLKADGGNLKIPVDILSITGYIC